MALAKVIISILGNVNPVSPKRHRMVKDNHGSAAPEGTY